jgi:DNA-binding MarR family transcriptional regulator
MSTDAFSGPDDCNCLAVRQAARHITQFYEQLLAPSGLRTTQFSILARLRRLGPMTINTLAADLVMDRTTLGLANQMSYHLQIERIHSLG